MATNQLKHEAPETYPNSLYENDILSEFLTYYLKTLGADHGYFHEFNPDSKEIETRIWSTSLLPYLDTDTCRKVPVKKVESWKTVVNTQNHHILIGPGSFEENGYEIPPNTFKIHSWIIIPIVADREVSFILGAGFRTKVTHKAIDYAIKQLHECWPDAASKLAQINISSIRHIREYGKNDPIELFGEMISAISHTIELRDEYTAGHQRNVAKISVEIAKRLGWSEFKVQGLRIGAEIHDVGKLLVPSEYLSAPGHLSNVQFEVIKEHAINGSRIFEDIRTPWPIAKMIQQHHERMNGTGYPNGLRGEEIIPEARIMAVADTFDAMATDRPYRKAPGVDAALNEIREGRMVRYDPYVVDAMFGLYQHAPKLFETKAL